MTATLEQLLETLVRPALRAHNGDVELVGYQDEMCIRDRCHLLQQGLAA